MDEGMGLLGHLHFVGAIFIDFLYVKLEMRSTVSKKFDICGMGTMDCGFFKLEDLTRLDFKYPQLL